MSNPFLSPRTPVQRSNRNARGAGWHKRGYRDKGYMWINVRRGSYGHTRGMDVNEFLTVAELWNQVVRTVAMEDGFPVPEDWSVGLTSKKRLIEPSDELVTTLFDGGETIYVKIYDGEGEERVYDPGSSTWVYHVPGQRCQTFGGTYNLLEY